MKKLFLISTLSLAAMSLSSCDLENQLTTKDKDQKETNGDQNLLDSDVLALQNEALETAKSQDAAGTTETKAADTPPATPLSPTQEVAEAIKVARDRTLEILGISSKPYDELRASLATIKTLCQPSIEDCRQKVVAARDKFAKDIDEMTKGAAAARNDPAKKEKLDKIFADTQNVFLQCDVTTSFKKCSLGKKDQKFKMGTGQDKKLAPLTFIGSGEVNGTFADLMKVLNKKDRPYGLTPDDKKDPATPEKPLSDTCKQALEKLKATITASK